VGCRHLFDDFAEVGRRLRWHSFQGAQGLPKKLASELLTADHPLEFRNGRRRDLGPAHAIQALGSKGVEGPEPIVRRRARHAESHATGETPSPRCTRLMAFNLNATGCWPRFDLLFLFSTGLPPRDRL
jgi:hypothetical protein